MTEDNIITQMFVDAAAYVGCSFNVPTYLRLVEHPRVGVFTTAAGYLSLGTHSEDPEDLERAVLGRRGLWRLRPEMIELGVLEEPRTGRRIVTAEELKAGFDDLIDFVTDPGGDNDVVVVQEGKEVCVLVPQARYAALNLALRTYQRHHGSPG